MTTAEKLAALQAWEAHVKAISAVYEADRIACGALIESPRWEAVYGLLSAHTMMVAQAIAPDDADATEVVEWLDWWQELDFGAKPKQAGIIGQEMREIRTLEDLLWIIEARP
jgi:hypothetical protein